MTQDIKLSHHGEIRKQQRGIKDEEIDTVLHWGRCIHKQGLRFHYLPKSTIRDRSLAYDDSLSNLIVITDGKGIEIITCYKSDKGVHRIKKKSKRLAKRKNNWD